MSADLSSTGREPSDLARMCECGHGRGLHRAHEWLDEWFDCQYDDGKSIVACACEAFVPLSEPESAPLASSSPEGITEQRLAEIEGRANVAKPGPWVWDRRERGDWGHQAPDLNSANLEAGAWHACTTWKPDGTCMWGDDSTPIRGEPGAPHEHWMPASVITSWGHDADGVDVNDADAEFIAHAREDVPWLLAQVRSLREVETFRRYLYPLTARATAQGIKGLVIKPDAPSALELLDAIEDATVRGLAPIEEIQRLRGMLLRTPINDPRREDF